MSGRLVVLSAVGSEQDAERIAGALVERGLAACVNVVPGGPSGIAGDPGYATQLATWLTADYHQVRTNPSNQGGEKETGLNLSAGDREMIIDGFQALSTGPGSNLKRRSIFGTGLNGNAHNLQRFYDALHWAPSQTR